MDASQYSINFPYGATSEPYSQAHPHRGDDRAAPEGTPVLVAGVQIGIVGSTGLSTGPHLHLQEYQGSPANTRQPQNSFKGGTVIAATSSSDFGNYVTIQISDGWNDIYAHLSRIDVTVGQVIGGNEVSTVGDNEIDQMSWAYFGYGASQEFIDEHRGTESNTFERFMYNHPVAIEYRKQVTAWREAAEAGKYKPINQTVYIKETT